MSLIQVHLDQADCSEALSRLAENAGQAGVSSVIPSNPPVRNSNDKQSILITGDFGRHWPRVALELARTGPADLGCPQCRTAGQSAAECRSRRQRKHSWSRRMSAEEKSCQALIARTVEKFGGLDVLVNNAGRAMWSRVR